ncbi:phage tail assembly protein [Pseudomonas knackmussii]|uniref:phage tail assembly protein n=1 Tax=Pseudomonas knackmussii TaxID=65741 RepID=UPI0013635D5B|nr:phage tail assembly protein [Pseudomonas knackmussii]
MSNQDKRWEGLTITRDLAVGVYFAGTRHKSFTLRVPMAGDLIAAQEAHPNGPLQLVTLEVYRQQLVALGDIPAEAITTDLLRAELAEADLAIIGRADEELEKKLAPPSAGSTTGGE